MKSVSSNNNTRQLQNGDLLPHPRQNHKSKIEWKNSILSAKQNRIEKKTITDTAQTGSSGTIHGSTMLPPKDPYLNLQFS